MNGMRDATLTDDSCGLAEILGRADLKSSETGLCNYETYFLAPHDFGLQLFVELLALVLVLLHLLLGLAHLLFQHIQQSATLLQIRSHDSLLLFVCAVTGLIRYN